MNAFASIKLDAFNDTAAEWKPFHDSLLDIFHIYPELGASTLPAAEFQQVYGVAPTPAPAKPAALLDTATAGEIGIHQYKQTVHDKYITMERQFHTILRGALSAATKNMIKSEHPNPTLSQIYLVLKREFGTLDAKDLATLQRQLKTPCPDMASLRTYCIQHAKVHAELAEKQAPMADYAKLEALRDGVHNLPEVQFTLSTCEANSAPTFALLATALKKLKVAPSIAPTNYFAALAAPAPVPDPTAEVVQLRAMVANLTALVTKQHLAPAAPRPPHLPRHGAPHQATTVRTKTPHYNRTWKEELLKEPCKVHGYCRHTNAECEQQPK